MTKPTRVVRLLKNELYPTYQLYAQMASRRTSPADGMEIAVRCVLEWLLERLGENAPDELRERIEAGETQFSYHLSQGHVIDVVALPEQGTWSLLISEPDLGSDPGNAEQAREAVPGRMLETNIGFTVSGGTLECGFQTIASDPEGTAEDAAVYRLTPVRRLLEDPDFGLRQVVELTKLPLAVGSQDALKELLNTWHSDENRMPCVVFTEAPKKTTVPDIASLPSITELTGRPGQLPAIPGMKANTPLPKKAAEPTDASFDAERFAASCFTFCRTYRLTGTLTEKLSEALHRKLQPGEIVVLEPERYGGGIQVYPYSPLKTKREETQVQLKAMITAYPRRKPYDFGGVMFLTAAHQNLLRSGEENVKLSESAAQKREAELTAQLDALKENLRRSEENCSDLRATLERQKEYQRTLEAEKAALREKIQQAEETVGLQLQEKDEEIAYLRRKLTRPQDHTEIAEWTRQQFAGRLIMHPKAEALLEEKSARSVSLELICDALDFLATDYWSSRYERISKDEMLKRCGEKYGRPFEVKPTGTQTVEHTPGEYKIKYRIGALGKPVESPLDYHLCVGNDMEFLLRIYFLHDDEKKLIVVGSLPHHLTAIKIQ